MTHTFGQAPLGNLLTDAEMMDRICQSIWAGKPLSVDKFTFHGREVRCGPIIGMRYRTSDGHAGSYIGVWDTDDSIGYAVLLLMDGDNCVHEFYPIELFPILSHVEPTLSHTEVEDEEPGIDPRDEEVWDRADYEYERATDR